MFQTMAKVITSVLKFPPDQTQKILERENARTLVRIDKKFWSSGNLQLTTIADPEFDRKLLCASRGTM